MLPDNDLDGIDFKPFFDMVVGVLFVLIILIGAQLLFQRVQQSETSAKEAQRHLRDWQVQEKNFLARVADNLHARGIDARIDIANTSIVLPLETVAQFGPDGLPDTKSGPINDVGQVLSQNLGCVSMPNEHSGDCAAFGLLHLNEVVAQVRTGSLAAGTSLPQDRFGRLLSDLFAASLLKGSPSLLRLSGNNGDMLFRISSSIAAGNAALPGKVGGDLAILFQFAPP